MIVSPDRLTENFTRAPIEVATYTNTKTQTHTCAYTYTYTHTPVHTRIDGAILTQAYTYARKVHRTHTFSSKGAFKGSDEEMVEMTYFLRQNDGVQTHTRTHALRTSSETTGLRFTRALMQTYTHATIQLRKYKPRDLHTRKQTQKLPHTLTHTHTKTQTDREREREEGGRRETARKRERENERDTLLNTHTQVRRGLGSRANPLLRYYPGLCQLRGTRIRMIY